MAKKKTEAPVVNVQEPAPIEDVAVETTGEKVETVGEQPKEDSAERENTEELAKIEPQSEEKHETHVVVANEEIPESVKSILKVFNQQPELYVSASGRVYTADTKPSIRGNAILYKNPFYNSKS